jgi:hypothetical protein
MISSAQSKFTPVWRAAADSRSRAVFIVSTLFATMLALLVSAFVCPFPLALRVGEVSVAVYFIFHLLRMISQLWKSRGRARTGLSTDRLI